MSASDIQIGGEHYLDMKITPMKYAMDNDLNALQFSIIKYVSRYKKKGGLEDLKKAEHCINLLKEWEYGN